MTAPVERSRDSRRYADDATSNAAFCESSEVVWQETGGKLGVSRNNPTSKGPWFATDDDNTIQSNLLIRDTLKPLKKRGRKTNFDRPPANSTGGMISFPVTGSSDGRMSKTASTFEIASHMFESARKRPGHILVRSETGR